MYRSIMDHIGLRRSCAAWCAALVAGILSVIPAAAQQSGAPAITVSVLVFSGRPDPTFDLRPAEQAKLVALLKAAPTQESAGRETVIPAILGYKGIVVENPTGIGEVPKRVEVFGGSIEVGVERKEFFADPSNRVASFLLDLAIERGVIPDALLKRIREQGLR